VVQLDRASETARETYFPAAESIYSSSISKTTTYWLFEDASPPPKTPKAHTLIQNDSSLPIAQIATVLESSTGLSFTGAYSQRIGSFECHQPTSASKSYTVTFPPQPLGTSLTHIQIRRTEEAANDAVHCQIQLRNIHDIILDRVINIDTGECKSVPVCAGENFSAYSVSVYRCRDGNIIFHERRQLLRGISLTGKLATHQTRVSDNRLSKKLPEALRAKLETQTSGITTYSNVSLLTSDTIESGLSLQSLISSKTGGAQTTPARLFKRGQEGQVDFILFIKGLCANQGTSDIIIADPFFDAAATERLLPRLAERGLAVTIITSLSSRTFAPWETENISRLIRKNAHILPAKLKVINVSRGNDQAFHDRYVYIRRPSKPSIVLLLSNSINKAAGRWNLCVAPVLGTASAEIEDYLLGLSRGLDTSGNSSEALSTSQLWPEDIGPTEEVARMSKNHDLHSHESLRALRGSADVLGGLFSALEGEDDFARQLHLLTAIGDFLGMSGCIHDDRAAQALTTTPDAGAGAALDLLTKLSVNDDHLQTSPLFSQSAIKLLTSDSITLDSISIAESFNGHMLTSQSTHHWGVEFTLSAVSRRMPNILSQWIAGVEKWSTALSTAVIRGWIRAFEDLPKEQLLTTASESSGALRTFLVSRIIGGFRHMSTFENFDEVSNTLDAIGIPHEDQHWLSSAAILSSIRRGDASIAHPADLANYWPSDVASKDCQANTIEVIRQLGASISIDSIIIDASQRGINVPEWVHQDSITKFRHYLQEEGSPNHLGDWDARRVIAYATSWKQQNPARPSLGVLPNIGDLKQLQSWALWPLARRSDPERWSSIRSLLCSTALCAVLAVDSSTPGRFYPALVQTILIPAQYMIDCSHENAVAAPFREAIIHLTQVAVDHITKRPTEDDLAEHVRSYLDLRIEKNSVFCQLLSRLLTSGVITDVEAMIDS